MQKHGYMWIFQDSDCQENYIWVYRIRDGTWNVLNIQHITPKSKRQDYSDIPSSGT